MIRPGLTLVELLFALVLLASLSIVAIQWSVSMGQAAERAHTDARWRFAAEALLDQIERDVLVGNNAELDELSHAMGTINLESNTLTLHTLYHGAVDIARKYQLEDDVLVVRSNPQHLGTPALSDVRLFEAIEHDGSITITLGSRRRQVSRRTIAIGAGS